MFLVYTRDTLIYLEPDQERAASNGPGRLKQTLNKAVDRICLPSGLHRSASNPATPSSILQVQSDCSIDHT